MQEREILFRGKRVDNGEWVYGYYTLYGQSKGLHPAIITGTEEGCVIPAFIDPETRGEYTGLTDKNGVKIFEGDILKMSSVYYGSLIFRKVEISKGNTYVSNYNFSQNLYDTFMSSTRWDVEVIGNIYDNPELLKEK